MKNFRWSLGETWIDAEELAYDRDLECSPRMGLVRLEADLVKVRLGVPDTFFSIPALLAQEYWTMPVDLAKYPAGHHSWLKEQYLLPQGTPGYVCQTEAENGAYEFEFRRQQ